MGNERVAIVTGGARGIGRAITEELVKRGIRVAIADLSEEAVQQTAQEIGTDKVFGVKANVTSAADVEAMVEEVINHFGHVDILINNAGITRDQLLMRMKDEEWDAVINVHLKGTYLCSKAVVRPMLKQKWGRIISIASVVGLMGNPGQTNYSAAKAGIIGFTKSLAREVATRGITVNAIAPGFIESEMTAKLSDKARKQLADQIPMGKVGYPSDVAKAIAFLASDDAAYITGQVLNVDGGLVMS